MHNRILANLDHIFRYNNTHAFVVKRLIPRFVTSNPSPGYITAVENAFRSGEHNGTVYSSQYRNLGATMAAILLHPGAQLSARYSGVVRELMLKVIHIVRAMEYKDDCHFPAAARRHCPRSHPEFQIFTPSLFVSCLNVMLSLFKTGVNTKYCVDCMCTATAARLTSKFCSQGRFS